MATGLTDDVALLDASRFGGRSTGHSDNGNIRYEDLSWYEKCDEQQNEWKECIDAGAGCEYSKPFPSGLSGKAAWVTGILLAQHPNEATKRKPIHRIFGLTVLNSPSLWGQSNPKLKDANADELGDGEVAKLMHNDQE
jgi:hypothetical protein